MKKLYLLLSSATLVLVLLGGYVRATGAGLSCPDWPLCFGRVVPEIRYGVAQEYIHRVLASLVSAAVFLICWRSRSQSPAVRSVARVMLLLLLIQVVLGGLTVLMQLNPLIVTAHLATGTLFFLVAAIIGPAALNGRLDQTAAADRPLRKFFLFSLLVLFLQIVLGGFVGSSGAALICSDIPLCHGELWPTELGGAGLIQMGHRMLAVFVLSLFVVLWWQARGTAFGPIVNFLLPLVVLQIVLGTLNVIWHIPVAVTLGHLLVAELLLLGLAYCYFNFEFIASGRNRS